MPFLGGYVSSLEGNPLTWEKPGVFHPELNWQPAKIWTEIFKMTSIFNINLYSTPLEPIHTKTAQILPRTWVVSWAWKVPCCTGERHKFKPFRSGHEEKVHNLQGENAAFAVLLLLDFCLFRSSVFVSVTIAMAFYCPNAPTFLMMMMMMMTTFAFLALPTLATTPFFRHLFGGL